MSQQTFIAKVKQIIITTGKDGVLVPNISIEPVLINGKKFTLVSLRKFNILRKRDIRVGDAVEIGVHNPYILNVQRYLPEMRLEDSKPFVAPTHCPACDKPLMISKDRYTCTNYYECPAIIHRRISNAMLAIKEEKKTAPDTTSLRHIVTGLGIKCFADLYDLDKEQVSKVLYVPHYVTFFIERMVEFRSIQFSTFLRAAGFTYKTSFKLSTMFKNLTDLNNNYRSVIDYSKDKDLVSELGAFYNSALLVIEMNKLAEKVVTSNAAFDN